MPSYAYRAYNESGQRRDGRIEAAGTAAAEQALWLEGLKIVEIHPAPPKKTMADYFPSLYRISQADIILFTRQLATFVGAGVPMSRALGVIAEETASPLFKRVILAVLAGYLRRDLNTLRRVRTAMVYPAVILVVAAGVVLILVFFALPAFTRIFAEFKVELPLPTRILLGIVDAIRTWALVIVGVIVALAGGIVVALRTERGQIGRAHV